MIIVEPAKHYLQRRAQFRSHLLATAGYAEEVVNRARLLLQLEHGQPSYGLTTALLEVVEMGGNLSDCAKEAGIIYFSLKNTEQLQQTTLQLLLARKITAAGVRQED